MIRVGFTGTREGTTKRQRLSLRIVMSRITEAVWGADVALHHGCCKGADVDAHVLACAEGWRVVGHPPADQLMMFPGFKEKGGTSEAAAKWMSPTSSVLRDMVWRELLAVYPKGLTADEAAALIGHTPFATRPRFSELFSAGAIRKGPERRRNISTKGAWVWHAGLSLSSPLSEVRRPLPFIERNHAIVDETLTLLAAPKTMSEELRSGTWATVRYAKQRGHSVTIIWPNGTCTPDF